MTISDKISVGRHRNLLRLTGDTMQRPIIEEHDIDELFFNDELYCNFCVDMNRKSNFDKEHPATLPPCNKCTGLIYAMKSKIYFVVN